MPRCRAPVRFVVRGGALHAADQAGAGGGEESDGDGAAAGTGGGRGSDSGMVATAASNARRRPTPAEGDRGPASTVRGPRARPADGEGPRPERPASSTLECRPRRPEPPRRRVLLLVVGVHMVRHLDLRVGSTPHAQTHAIPLPHPTRQLANICTYIQQPALLQCPPRCEPTDFVATLRAAPPSGRSLPRGVRHAPPSPTVLTRFCRCRAAACAASRFARR